MKQEQALTEAKARFGEKAFAKDFVEAGNLGTHVVGVEKWKGYHLVYGSGSSYEAALATAEVFSE